MTDLREKIVEIFCEWNEDETAESVADRILALLPKVLELQWDEYGSLILGDTDEGIKLGEIEPNIDGTWRGGTSYKWITWDATTQEEARAAVEAAVRKALGWAE